MSCKIIHWWWFDMPIGVSVSFLKSQLFSQIVSHFIMYNVYTHTLILNQISYLHTQIMQQTRKFTIILSTAFWPVSQQISSFHVPLWVRPLPTVGPLITCFSFHLQNSHCCFQQFYSTDSSFKSIRTDRLCDGNAFEYPACLLYPRTIAATLQLIQAESSVSAKRVLFVLKYKWH